MQKVVTIVFKREISIYNGIYEHAELKPYFEGGFKVIHILTSTVVVKEDIIHYITCVLEQS